MIRKPKLKPRRGYVEVGRGGVRMYRNIKTGALVAPDGVKTADEQAQAEFEERFRRTDEYALLDYVLMMEGVK